MNPRLREARADAQRRRIVSLLETLAAETGNDDVTEKTQCDGCGEYFQNVGAHRQHCSGPK